MEGQIQPTMQMPGSFRENVKRPKLASRTSQRMKSLIQYLSGMVPVLGVMGRASVIASDDTKRDRQQPGPEHWGQPDGPIQAIGPPDLRREVSRCPAPEVHLRPPGHCIRGLSRSSWPRSRPCAVASRIGPVAVDDPVRDLGGSGSRTRHRRRTRHRVAAGDIHTVAAS